MRFALAGRLLGSVVGLLMFGLVAGASAAPAPGAPAPQRAEPPSEPNGPHPRILLDPELRAAWKSEVKQQRGPIMGAIRLCQQAGDTTEHDGAMYQGAGWAKALQACLVAWAATDRRDYGKTAVRFFTALIDDLDRVGDRLGGNKAAERDKGYAIRNLGPYTAIAYDWLHDLPEMTPQLRERARERWAAWLAWYKDNGYRARAPGTNYQAGYLVAATLISIAQAGEAGGEGALLWRFVADELWGKDMRAAFATGGILEGGDWPEGWQYGPLAVASYSLAARVARKHGIQVDGVDAWLAAMLRRHVYGLSPANRVHVGQDTQAEEATLGVNPLTLDAIALGDAAPEDKKWARGELARLKLAEDNYLIYDALATIGDRPELIPRAGWPTWYLSANTGTLFARTRWDERAIWFVTECQHALDVDHRHPKAGNFVLSRGADDVIVDPSPYGALSTLTSNAPTVASAQLPKPYIPSQAPWSERTGWDWVKQTRSGVVAARCDYSDQYRFQHRASDVPDALRDLVLLPSADGTDAALVIIDRASTGGADRPLYLRFRVPGRLAIDKEVGTAVIGPGKTHLTIAGVLRTSGTPTPVTSTAKDCFAEGVQRGKCDAARLPVTDYRLQLSGPEPRAAHVISATGGQAATASAISGPGWGGVRVIGVRDAVIVWPDKLSRPTGGITYRAPRGPLLHVVLGAAEPGGKAAITARAVDKDCEVTVAPGGNLPGRPAVVTLDQACAVTVDPDAERATTATTKPPPPPLPAGGSRSARSGCCGAQTSPETPLAATFVVGLVLLRGRRRRR